MQKKDLITNFLANRNMAIAGVSRSGKKFGNIIMKTLSAKGYQFHPVHPEVSEINGMSSVSSIADLPDGVEDLLLVIPPARTEEVVHEIPGSGIKRVWMQQGSESLKAIQFCEENSVDLVHGECILMFSEPQGLHKFHHWLWKLLGKTPN